MGKRADRKTVEVRVRLDAGSAARLGVVAAIRGQTPSEVVAWALVPHLAFALPALPDVELRAVVPPAGDGRGSGIGPPPVPDGRTDPR